MNHPHTSAGAQREGRPAAAERGHHQQRTGARPFRARSSSAGRQRGAVLIEFAIVAPLLFALLLALITGGLTLSRKNSVTNATREGSRLGATAPRSSSWATDVRDRVRSIAGGDLTDAQICVQLVTSSNVLASGAGSNVLGSECSVIPAPALPAGIAGTTQCVVKVWVHRTSAFEAVVTSRIVNLDAFAVSRFERGIGAACASS